MLLWHAMLKIRMLFRPYGVSYGNKKQMAEA